MEDGWEQEEREEIKLGEKRIDEGPTGPWGWFLMVAFFAPFIFFAPKLLTAIYLAVTMTVIAIVAKVRKDRFRELILNNDWVLWSVLGMFLISWAMAGLNPLVPRDPIRGLWDSLRSVPELPSTRSVVSGAFWRTINWWFFGEWRTRGWSSATGFYLVWIVPAVFVSKWDETLHFLGSLLHGDKEKSILRRVVGFFLGDLVAEKFWRFFGVFKMVALAIVFASTTTACSRPNLERKLQALQNKPAAETSEGAKALYDEVEKFVQDLEEYQASGGKVPAELVVRATALRAQRAAQRGVAELKEGKIWATITSWFGFGGGDTPLTPEKKEEEKLEREKLEREVDLFGEGPFDKKRWP